MKWLFYFNYFLVSLIFPEIVKASDPIIFTPKWTAQAQFTGYYVADKLGFYKDEGVDLHIRHAAISESSFSCLEKGRAQVVVMNLSYALTARNNGSKLVNIMQTSQVNSLMLVSHTPLKGLASLQGQKIAVWNHLSQELLDQLAKHYNLNVEWVRFNSGIDLFLSKAVNICLMGSYNEYIQLAECGINMDATHIMRFSDYGYNLPEDGVYVTEDFLKQNREIVNKIVKASIRGWEWANQNQEKALDIVMEIIHQNNIGTNRYHQRKMLEEVLRLQVDRQTKKRSFHLSQEAFDRSADNLLPDKTSVLYKDFVK